MSQAGTAPMEQPPLIDTGGFSYLVTHEQLGEVLGLGHSMIGKLRDEGMPQVRRGVYDLRQCVPWYVDKWRRTARPEGGDELTTRAALNIAQREKIEFETARARGEHLPRGVVRAFVEALMVTVATQLDAFGARARDELAAIADPGARARWSDDEVRRIRAQLAEQVRAIDVGAVLEPAAAPPKRKSRRARRAAEPAAGEG